MVILSIEDFNRLVAGDLLRITRTETFQKIFVRQNSKLTRSDFQQLSEEFTGQLNCSAAQGEAFLVLMLHYLGIKYESSQAAVQPLSSAVAVPQGIITKREFSKDEKRSVFEAVKQGKVEIVATFVQQGYDLETKLRNQKTALLVAASENKPALVEYLIGVGADINAEDSENQTALSYAIINRNEKLIELILPNSSVRSLDIALYACNRNDADPALVHKIVEAGADPYSHKVWIPSPIVQAVKTGKVAILDTYISSLNSSGRSPELGGLMEELLKWYPKNAVYHLLIRHGVEKTYQDGTGRNMISLTITYNDIMLEDITSLETYAEQERLAMITLLSQEGIDINQGDYMGRTPLHYAVGENNPTIASLLLRLGANPDQQDVYQKSPLQYATEKRYKELMTILSAKHTGGTAAQESEQGTGNTAPASVGRRISFE
ncbi:ankyrin repeat domain-containing protein [Paenibacillus sp. WQ 127069]|uniref:Ankyrin repeat domain-containing protein n=1 Tax=Paenibacillus baimaensis TaxID=2982185 RepID=A0ABT2UF33_9BACL|nr:ankyrin repeat domain-containing protein [Paenibacillus sp. WQ 127069]MCU6793225.1 ankyrin repeat domain-containing protein [Paenibacillus sp. WQ 127069]